MILEDLRENLAELDQKMRKSSSTEGKLYWVGGIGLAAINYFAPERLVWWMAGIALVLLFRLVYQLEYLLIHQERNEAVGRSILRKLESMRPDTF